MKTSIKILASGLVVVGMSLANVSAASGTQGTMATPNEVNQMQVEGTKRTPPLLLEEESSEAKEVRQMQEPIDQNQAINPTWSHWWYE